MAHSHGHDHDHPAHGEHGHDHDDDHAHSRAHGHSHTAGASIHRLFVALGILGTFTLVEAAGGYFANSLALLAEAAHMLADSASLLLAIAAIRISQRPASARRTYGHRRYQPLAAFVNGQALLLLTLWVVYEAVMRLKQLPAVNGRLMFGIAVVGGLANLGAFLALSGARSLNERGARAHVLSDLLGSVAACVAAMLIIFRGWTIADPLLSLLVAGIILRSAWSLIRESADVLLESAPPQVDLARVESELMGRVPGLRSVHHIHVWSMTGERPTVTLHAHLEPGAQQGVVISAIHACLEQRLNVEHTTVQIEEEGPCQAPPCGDPLPDRH